MAEPLFGASALLSILTAGRRLRRRSRRGHGRRRRDRGRRDPVPLTTTPYIHDVPAAEALAAWRAALRGGRLPRAPRAGARRARRRRRPGDRRAGVGARAPRPPSTPRRWTASRCARPTPSGRARARRSLLDRRRLRRRRHRRPDARRLRRRRHARARPPRRRRPGRAARRRRRPTSTCARSARTSARPSCCCPRATGCARSTSPPRPPRAPPTCSCAGARAVAVLPTGDEIRPVGRATGRGEILDTNSLMLAAQAREAGGEARALPIVPDDPDADRRRAARRGRRGRPRHRGRRLERAAATTTPPPWSSAAGTLAVHGVAVRPGHPVVLGAVDATPVLGAPGYPVSAALTFEIFAVPLLAALEGAAPRRAPAGPRSRWPASSPRPWAWTTGCASASGASAASSWPRRCRAAPACSPRSCAPTACCVVPAALEGHHAGERGRGRAAARRRRDRPHDRRRRLARPRARPRRLRAARASTPAVTLASSNVGSLGGLVALRDGLCHLAGSHLLDPATGEYTLPYVDRVLGGRDVAVVRLVHRDQGLIVAPGNPLGLTGIDDLARPGLRYVNRQRGAGHARAARPRARAAGASRPTTIAGYAREEHTHLAVAAAVAAGRADAGLGVLAAARAFGLGFVPGHARALRPRARRRDARGPGHRPAVGAAGASPASARPSRPSAATGPRRWAAGSASARS